MLRFEKPSFFKKETFYQNVDFLRRRLPFREVALLQMTFKSRQRSNFSTHGFFCEILILKSCHIFLTFRAFFCWTKKSTKLSSKI